MAASPFNRTAPLGTIPFGPGKNQKALTGVPAGQPLTPMETVDEGESSVLMFFPKEVKLTLAGFQRVTFSAGMQEVPEKYAKNSYLLAHGARLHDSSMAANLPAVPDGESVSVDKARELVNQAVATYQDKLTAVTTELASANSKIDELTKDNHDLDTHNDELIAENTSMQASNKALSDELTSLKTAQPAPSPESPSEDEDPVDAAAKKAGGPKSQGGVKASSK